MRKIAVITGLVLLMLGASCTTRVAGRAPGASAAVSVTKPDFADFDRRAKAGEHLTVVFFGASLTWGANATDQANTSYRAVVADLLEKAYPNAHFKCYDAAIGGTGSQLGVFRLERDVLRRKPDLVFLDFTANDVLYSDDPETLASYESLIRRIIVEGHAPVVQVVFPFGGDVHGNRANMKRLDANLALTKAYNTVVGDAVTLCTERVKEGKATVPQIWPNDYVHPGDLGYRLFAEAAWSAFQEGVQDKRACQAPEKMLYADTYMKWARVRISSLYTTNALPAGWRVGTPNLTSAWYDALMSRWLDDEVIASGRAGGKTESLKAKFRGSMVLLFGEKTVISSHYRVLIDGQPASSPGGRRGHRAPDEFDASATGFGGNVQIAETLAVGLDPAVEHTIEIEPLFTGESQQELRLESICVAGGDAWVRLP